jgi:hypothetical protein
MSSRTCSSEHAGLLLQHNDQGCVVGGWLCDCPTGTGETPAIARATNLRIGWSLGTLFPFFVLVRLRAFVHMRLAGPCHNFAAVQDLSDNLAN